MVVTRRQNGQAAVTSRPNSAHIVPKPNKAKALNAAAVDPSIPDDVKEGAKPNKSKSKQKKHKKKARKQTFLSLLTQIFLFIVTVYTLSVCPDDHALDSPVCRGLYVYRKLVLEPYIIPPIQYAFHHPVIQSNVVQPIQPWVQKATPVYQQTTRVLGPVYRRSVKGYKQHVIPLWRNQVVPLWNRHVLPIWTRHVLPPWNKHVSPLIAPYLSPVQDYSRTIVRLYYSAVDPYVRIALRALYYIYLRLQPYVALGLQKSYDGYQQAKPYAAPAWDQVKSGTGSLSAQLGSKRREFVDPHLERIWDKVKELSNRDTAPAEFSSVTVVPEPKVVLSSSSSEPATEATTIEPTGDVQPEQVETSVPTHSAESVIEQIRDAETGISAEQPVELIDVTESAVATPSAADLDPKTVHDVSPTAINKAEEGSARSEPLVSASSIISASAHDETIVASLLEQVQLSQTETADAQPTAALVPGHEEEGPIGSDDLDDFYAALGLDDNLTESAASDKVAAEPTEPAEETEEERAARQAEIERKAKLVAEKRANIEGRHTAWEEKIEALMLSQAEDLRKLLGEMRMNAVKDFEENDEFKTREDKLVQEAEKLLKGIEVYYKSLSNEKRPNDQKKTMWFKVVGKVEDKWKELLTAYQGLVHEWYVNVVNTETAKVYESMAIVKELADKAQADIGLDYAWLDDVTYEDWQRYHRLLDRSSDYQYIAQGIQNGTDASAPEDIVMHALDALNEELADVVTGFETRLRRIKRNGDRVFSGKDSLEAEPEVSVLPISHVEADEAVIGKSKEQIEQALGGLEPPQSGDKQKVEHVEL